MKCTEIHDQNNGGNGFSYEKLINAITAFNIEVGHTHMEAAEENEMLHSKFTLKVCFLILYMNKNVQGYLLNCTYNILSF